MAKHLPEQPLDSYLEICLRNNIRVVHFDSEGYPESLLSTPDPPAILYFTGSVLPNELLHPVAVIGSRRCSIYGRTMARKLSKLLCSSGASVISGLARGIDGEAHKGALDGGGPTVAVMAGGLDIIYPPEHKALAGKIAEAGCLISEYPPGVKPAKYTFPERNRIISGLANVVVVVEAGERSGTMITVGTALDQGREVYAVPGDVNRSSSRGSNRLLRDGAGIVLSPEELIVELGLQTIVGKKDVSDPILSAVMKEMLTIAQLSQLLDEDFSTIQSRLLEFELNGLVIRRPGGTFAGV